ncbi:MAG: hypothetical protein KGP28_12055, partial [Bdellovibrionales bacterium]|nr:hypothetical protein [Bdellovibrionales bacterium]
IQKTRRPLSEIFPKLRGLDVNRYRLVSPSHSLSKRTSEFFVCGQDGKRRARMDLGILLAGSAVPDRGSILENAGLHGDPALSQIHSAEVRD